MNKGYLRFQGLGVVCIVVVYLLILAGGVVRSTGSGMGCPDWPRCFGKIIPPTKESELPPDYQETYKNHGYGTMKFNVVKTWIEYVNRLLGAITGIFVLALFICSFTYRKSDKSIVQLSGLVLLLVIIEGIIGKYVVSTNLKPLMVSIHMWGSLIIIVLLIFTVVKSKKERFSSETISEPESLKSITLTLIILTVFQIIIGTQVRQDIDIISSGMDFNERDTWVSQLGSVFYIHRSFSILLFLAHLYFVYKVYNSFKGKSFFSNMTYLLMMFLVVEIIAGILLNYWDMPAVAQPIHMLFGSLILGLQFFILFILNFTIQRKESLKIVNA